MSRDHDKEFDVAVYMEVMVHSEREDFLKQHCVRPSIPRDEDQAGDARACLCSDSAGGDSTGGALTSCNCSFATPAPKLSKDDS